MNLDWLFKNNSDLKSDLVRKSSYIPETTLFIQKEKNKNISDSIFSDDIEVAKMGTYDNLTIVKKSLSEEIQKGYDLLGRATMKKVLKSILEKIEEEEEKEEKDREEKNGN